jgi:hypothetical protein
LSVTRGAFRNVFPGIWSDPMTNDARLLALYVLTNRLRATEGFYELPAGLALAELDWNAERYAVAWGELEAADFAHYNPKAQVVFITRALKYQPPAGPKQVTGALRQIVSVGGAPELFARLWAAAEKYAPDLSAALKARYPEYVSAIR